MATQWELNRIAVALSRIRRAVRIPREHPCVRACSEAVIISACLTSGATRTELQEPYGSFTTSRCKAPECTSETAPGTTTCAQSRTPTSPRAASSLCPRPAASSSRWGRCAESLTRSPRSNECAPRRSFSAGASGDRCSASSSEARVSSDTARSGWIQPSTQLAARRLYERAGYHELSRLPGPGDHETIFLEKHIS